jgi:hypothetical protein
MIYVQGAHTFSPLTEVSSGSGQTTRGTRSANRVRVTYTFDRWLATSSSARTEWLSGRHVVGSFCQIKDIDRDNGDLVISCTVLAICSGLIGFNERDYMKESLYPHLRRTAIGFAETEFVEENFEDD